jgi:hypothetical protein
VFVSEAPFWSFRFERRNYNRELLAIVKR